MSSSISKHGRMGWFVPSIALTMAALAVAVLAMHSVPSVFAEAQRQGIIEVEGVYEGRTVLYILFDYWPETSESEDGYAVRRSFIHALRDIMLAYDDWPGRVPNTFEANRCGYEIATQADKERLVVATFWNDDLIPWSSSYDRIILRWGGAEALHYERGWFLASAVAPCHCRSKRAYPGRRFRRLERRRGLQRAYCTPF